MIKVNEYDVISAVSRSLDVESSEVLKIRKRVSKDVLDVHIICTALLRHECNINGVKIPKVTLQCLADMFHKKNHTSIWYFVKAYNDLMDTNKFFRAKVDIVLTNFPQLLIQQANGINKN
jgi:glycerophosphoryl diester phosphodiesterase